LLVGNEATTAMRATVWLSLPRCPCARLPICENTVDAGLWNLIY
jgi:hypothetical protein